MTIKPNQRHKAKTRSDLLTLLSEACELEHGLACSYLYAAFSLKTEFEEGGMSAEQLHMVKKWAAQLYLVASQEMFHLSQDWNLLNAIGGTPYYLRPNFPQASKYYPIGLPLVLEPFSERTLKRFILYELPRDKSERDYLKDELGYVSEDLYEYRTVGELYDMIMEGLKSLPADELFIGLEELQMGKEEVDFQEIVKVRDLRSALAGISKVVEQGEGNSREHLNSHYGIFCSILQEFTEERNKNRSSFDPVRNAIANPVVNLKGDYRRDRGTYITDEHAAAVADLFDDLYNLMLRTLHFVFTTPGQSPKSRKSLTQFAIAIMPMVLKPLGELIMKLPAGRPYPGKTAGPAFSMSRHVILPQQERLARNVIVERLTELCTRAGMLRQSHSAVPFDTFEKNLIRLKSYIDE